MGAIEDEYINDYLGRTRRMKAKGTYECRQTALKRFSKWLSGRDVTDIGPLDLEEYLAVLSDEGYAPNTIDTYFDSIHHFYSYLKRKEVIDENPASEVDRSVKRSLTNGSKKHSDSDIVYVSEDEKEVMVENAPPPQLRNRLVIRLLWQTGVRVHELVGIELEDIDRNERSIHIYSNKTNSARTVYYQSSLDFLLEQWIDGGYRDAHGPARNSPYLFPSKRSEQMGTSTVGDIVNEAAQEAGIQEEQYETQAGQPKWRITPHSFRHGHAIHALRSGIDIRTLQEHLGHSNIDTTEQYLRILDDDVKTAYTQFGA